MFNRNSHTIANTDPEVWAAIQAEHQRQEDHIELIASENYASPAVLQAAGTQLTNKYAEGYPGRRYYGGCEHVDVAEQLAIDRVKQLFGAEAANVQPHCGASANIAAFMAFLKPGDTIMGMSLAEGGHLTHGMPLNMSGKWFNVVSYGLNDKEAIDYDAMEKKAHENKPKLIIAGASAYSLEIDFARFAKVAKDIGAIFMVDMAHYAGLIAGGQYPNPVPHADVVTSTTHKSLRGPRSGFILMKAEHEKAINSAVFPGLQGGPLMHIIAAKAVAFKEALSPEFKQYAAQVKKNAAVVAETLTQRGLRIVSGGTQSHVMLVDLRSKGITGKEAEAVLGSAHMTINKNAIPNDPEKPMVTSGVRIGTPAMTTRGFKEEEARATANLVADVLDNPRDEANLNAVRTKVADLTKRFPVYG
ncbi:MAG: serine hydroxymethyltransferase [Brachymonas sp.]